VARSITAATRSAARGFHIGIETLWHDERFVPQQKAEILQPVGHVFQHQRGGKGPEGIDPHFDTDMLLDCAANSLANHIDRGGEVSSSTYRRKEPREMATPGQRVELTYIALD
jgi:hypothetical protein